MMDMRLYLENDILVKLDRASMRASLEGRVPLLNNDLVAYATSLPLDLKLRGLRSKYLLKRAMRGILPGRILSRPKKGFGIPVAEWFRGPLREQMLSVLSPERIGRQGLFDVRAVGGLTATGWSDRWVAGVTAARSSTSFPPRAAKRWTLGSPSLTLARSACMRRST